LRHTLTLAFVLTAFVALPVCAQENQRLAFVTEYIRGLGAIEEARALDEKELATDPNPMAGAIRGSTRMVLELQTQIAMLKSLNLGDTNHSQELVGNIIEIDNQKISLWHRMGGIAGSLMAGPDPGTDYAKLSAEMPEINAQLEFLDKTLFQATPLVFAVLISPTPDKEGHMSRLIITKEERDHLIGSLNSYFGDKLHEDNQNYIVSSAQLLIEFFNKGYECTDE
jgi:hypothetical protein